MSILSDFIVADRSEASSISSSEDRKRWPMVQSNGCTVLEVALLHFALTGDDPAAPASPARFVKNPFTKEDEPETVLSAYVDTFPCLDDSEERWLHELPAALVDELARADDLQAVAARWSTFEELEGATADVLTGLLVEIQGLARLAKREQKSLLLWTSL